MLERDYVFPDIIRRLFGPFSPVGLHLSERKSKHDKAIYYVYDHERPIVTLNCIP